MINYDSLNDDSVYYEAEERYTKENYPLLVGFENYNGTVKYASTLDEYLMFLIKGYINVGFREALDKHLMELLEDEWFYQWPLVHWAYASRLLYGTGCRKNVKRAVDILLPMAENGCPGAMYDIGYCYVKGLKLEQSYSKAIYYWTRASKDEYGIAQNELKAEYIYGQYGNYKELPVEIRFNFISEIKRLFIESRGGCEGFAESKLDEEDRKNYKRIYNEVKRLKKQVTERSHLRETASLFWNDDENPYKIEF